MKKRCTNSACRKIFTADSVCPYCGKEYPRIPSIAHEVYLINSGRRIGFTALAIRRFDKNLSLTEAKRMAENCPCVINKEMTQKMPCCCVKYCVRVVRLQRYANGYNPLFHLYREDGLYDKRRKVYA